MSLYNLNATDIERSTSQNKENIYHSSIGPDGNLCVYIKAMERVVLELGKAEIICDSISEILGNNDLSYQIRSTINEKKEQISVHIEKANNIVEAFINAMMKVDEEDIEKIQHLGNIFSIISHKIQLFGSLNIKKHGREAIKLSESLIEIFSSTLSNMNKNSS